MKKKELVVNFRRFFQILFLLFFLFLVFKTEFSGTFGGGENIRLPQPVRLFLEFDPLTGLATALSTFTLYKGLIFSVIILFLTFLFGRFFCSWICPFGSFNNFFSSFKKKKKSALIKENMPRKSHNLKYYILIFFLVSAFFSTVFLSVLDPIPFLIRSLGVGILPGFNYMLNGLITALSDSGISFLEYFGGLLGSIFKASVLTYKQTYFHFGFIIGLIFVLILYLNRWQNRFWCRVLCPLGALLGITSRFQIFGMEKDNDKCTKCNLCLVNCQGAAEPQGFVKWKSHECLMCFNCYESCPEDVISFRFFPIVEGIKRDPDLSRRRLILGAGAGVFFAPFIRSTTGLDKNYNPYLVRPPGALDEKEFLKRCIRCGECMKVCPTNAIQPTLLEAGVEGIWTPSLIMRIGYCEHTCVLCSQVCPTGAIWRITEEDKLGKDGKDEIVIGTASFNKNRCLPWAYSIPCIVCEEHCPTSPKAIWLEKAEVPLRDGKSLTVQKPHVDLEKCWGCGVCENVCPVQNKAGIYVTNIGESRSETNKILLERTRSRSGAI
ncbi:4Fe-4S dicluster domain-containing protein [candidate division KSB1 bacterium]